MSNGNIVRMPTQTQQGNWMWDGSQWTCGPCDNVPPFPNCPPPGFPPHGCPPWFSGPNSPPWYPGANAGVSFGTTFPPNPVRGHFFWNGQTLWLFDGAAWVDAAGAIPSSSAPSSPTTGQLWWNGSVLQVFNGTTWVTVGPSAAAASGLVIISATTPQNPVAGTEWWNGTVLQLWDGTAWKTVGPPAVAPGTATQNTFAIMQPTTLTVGTSTWTPVPYTATPNVDTQSAWAPGTWKLTPKVSGSYEFIARGFGSTTGQGLSIVKNDTGSFGNLQTDTVIGAITSSSGGGWMYVTGITMMNGTSDFVRVFGFSSTGSWLHVGQSIAFSAWLLP